MRPWLSLRAALKAAIVVLLLSPILAMASDAVMGGGSRLDLTASPFGIFSLIAFVVSYGFVINEEFLDLRKSKTVIVAAGFIWLMVSIAYTLEGRSAEAAEALRHNLLEYAELLLFLLAAMTYINTMEERRVFRALRAWLVSSGFSLRTIFWLTGLMAFLISPVADNLTTALLMGAVALAVGGSNKRFVTLSCINIVVGANAGGAFSPFGDITTLMVWQKGVVHFWQFFDLLIPAFVNWFVPALIMSFAVQSGKPEAAAEDVQIKRGGITIVGLFLFTIAMTVTMHNYLDMPPFIGMMTGLGLLKVYGYFIRRDELRTMSFAMGPEFEALQERFPVKPAVKPFDIFISMKRAEWDTLMFFYGVVLAVGGLGLIGYLAHLSHFMYVGLGATEANILVGILSSIVDNIPVMFAVLTMHPDMSIGQWLLVTLTAGVGGSLLSIGSAAGVALMGQARGVYTFFAHLRWTWAVALGYAGSIWIHFMINSAVLHTTP
jgi:Na+/H+ antiporter NhaD/arsenite permease-like protein